MPAVAKKYKVVVMGVGNILWADEGFGVRAVDAFHRRWKVPAGVEVIDGGVLGYFLAEYIENAERLLVFDCCDFHGRPGEVTRFADEDIRPWLATKVSVHQAGLNDLFATAMLLGRYPEHVTVLGCQPENIEDYGGSLTPATQAAIPKVLEAARRELSLWGFELEPRGAGEKVAPLAESCLEQDVYEQGRPAEDEACRFADPRFCTPQEPRRGSR
ncbi:HyaD/HybD family hydrogenase maturation endopeptidase [Mesosutterella sp. AGMB02718]|uniref:HyaD/HybD family hydrogenase maturation endopeptidase n=1 Tax=Mesosutterella faecium TaxID=2925194 RepID=A0ABT7IMF3_9BURK|nr:HyaD/HybD family hydrogenase maturation endopeptidase [Mesosutterella sp. AGMB02718]MDL2059543.1 HyaD/HybD family hydrogenase maturation endopeptidase [Mesosutterella sp. AGMB02718]